MEISALTDTTTGTRYELMDNDTMWAIIRMAVENSAR